MNNKRSDLVDALMGIATISVLLGHALQRGLRTGYEGNWVFEFIYSYHMPLFIVLSGYTLYLSDQKYGKVSRRRIKEKIFGLIYPSFLWNYIIWFVRDLPFVGIKPYINFPDNIGEYTKLLCKYPTYVIWFLWVVVICTMIIWLGKACAEDNWPLIVLFVYVVLSKMSIPYWGVSNVVAYLPYFAAGYAIANHRNGVLPMLMISGIGFVMETLFPKQINGLRGMFVAAFLICLICLVTKYLIHYQPIRTVLCFMGKYSLRIYLCQCICLNIGYGSGKVRVVTIFVTAMAISVFLAVLTTKIKVLSLILYGRK